MSEAIVFNDLQERYEQLLADHAHLKKVYDQLLFEFEKLCRRLIGPTKEHVSTEEDAQLSLLAVVSAMGRLQAGDREAAKDVEGALLCAKDLCSRDDKKANKGKPHGRRNVALEDLPVERIVIDPPERSAPGGERVVQIGEEVSEHIEHRAAPRPLIRCGTRRPDRRTRFRTSSLAAHSGRSADETTRTRRRRRTGAVGRSRTRRAAGS